MAAHLVKLIHARDLARWKRFPAYEEYSGKTLGEHRAEVDARDAFRTLIYAQRVVDGADKPVVYRTETVRTPWPISLPGRRSARIWSVALPETTFDADIGRVTGEQLIVPLFTRERRVQVRLAAPPRVSSASHIAWAEQELARASNAERETLRGYLASPEPEPALFVSHRWETREHPDPEGRQLEKLKALKNCYLIYDYTSFPQDTKTPEGQRILREVLDGMDGFIDKVLVVSAPSYMSRGWCLYEYIAGSLMHQIVCDEVRDPALVRLRNLVATKPNPPNAGISSTYREAVNTKEQLLLKAVNAILPEFTKAEFTVPGDRAIVHKLLIQRLLRALPRKHEYMQYVGEWKTAAWTEAELEAAFRSELQWEALQYNPTIPIFEPAVAETIAEAVATGFTIEQQPDDFERDPWDFSGMDRIVLMVKAGAVAVMLLLLWAVYRLVRFVVGI